MSFNKSFYLAAETEVRLKREANEQEFFDRQREFAAKCPEYVKYRNALADIGSKITRIILNAGADAPQKIALLGEENMRAQAEIPRLLAQRGYKKDYLDPIYTCPFCKDSGISADGRRCKCFLDIVKRLSAEEINRKSRMALMSFDNFDVSLQTNPAHQTQLEQNLQRCKTFAGDFHLPSEGLFMIGGTGIGKTHLSLAIAHVLIERGISVVYGSVLDLLSRIEQEHFSGGENANTTKDLLLSSDLLIIDDLGSERKTQFYDSTLYNIVNTRQNCGLPLVINTNCTIDTIYKHYGQRIMSRLMMLEKLDFDGVDIRQERAIRRKSGAC